MGRNMTEKDAQVQGRTRRDKEPLVGTNEVAAHLGFSRRTLYRWINKGLPVVFRNGRMYRFRLSEVEAWGRPKPSLT